MPLKVKKGDTLGKIAKANKTTVSELLKLNPGIKNANLILIGQSITLPSDVAETGPAAKPEDPKKPAAPTQNLPGVLEGGELVRRRFGPGGVEDDIYYQIFEFPLGSGSFVAYEFNSLEQVEATLGKNPDLTTRTQSWWDKNVLAESKAEEVIGQKGNWSANTAELMRDAASAAGVRDPGLVGQIASSPEMQQIMVQAMIGEWTPEQIKAEQRKTNFWKQTLYPGIENLYNMTSEPEREYANYVKQVEPSLELLGYSRDANGSFKGVVAEMLNQKIDSNVFLSQVPTFVRATQNAEFSSVLNQWAEQDLGRQIGFGDWFDLMAGESQPELDAVAEKATLQWVAQNRGTQLTGSEVERIAAESQLSPEQAQRAISEFNQGILSLGDEALGRYGLNRDELLSASVGITPQSGRTIDEVKLLVAKTAREQGLFDDDKINFYVGFNPLGQPNRPGLTTLAPEGA